MNWTLTLLLMTFTYCMGFAQNQGISMDYEPNSDNPYGSLNPDAPPETADFADIIGICDCISTQRNQDGSWQEELDMVWKFKYIMNGMAVQDEVWRVNGLYAGSIRQYQPDSAQWVISYFSYPSVPYKPGVWHGGKDGQDLLFVQPQKAPNGMDGFSKLRFHEISKTGFKWIGQWVDVSESITYPFWKIECIKRKD